MNRRVNRVGVLMGGPSAEREVSLKSGAAVARGLTEAGYDVSAIDLTSDVLALPEGLDAVFLALHGTYGEDGTVQAQLDALGLPYTGSGAEASRVAFDKVLTKEVLEEHGLPTAPYEVLKQAEDRTLELPLITKPVRQGSSIGIYRVFDEEAWKPAFAGSYPFDQEVLVEAFIEGRELTVGLVDGAVFPVVEVCAPEGNYDYEAKYLSGKTEYRIPAPLPPGLEEQCRAMALRAFRAVGCRGLGRVDFRLSPDGELYILEINTIPGFTETSLLPKAADAAGLSFPALCARIMETASTG